jgi:hypothetical protein
MNKFSGAHSDVDEWAKPPRAPCLWIRMEAETMLDARLTHQARSRSLTATEQAFAGALEAVFTGGTHDFSAVAQALQAQAVRRPSGATEPWSAASVAAELAAINASLDAHYARDGIGV